MTGDYERERFDAKARNMWRKREEYSEQVEREREERRAQRDARRAEIEAAKKVRKQRKETARTRFAQRLGCSPDGKLRSPGLVLFGAQGRGRQAQAQAAEASRWGYVGASAAR